MMFVLIKKIIFLLISLALLYCIPIQNQNTTIEAKQGILDLRNIDFSKTRIVDLRGEWEFYPDLFLDKENVISHSNQKTYITAPKPWNNFTFNGKPILGKGYGTYRLTILMPDYNYKLGLKILDMGTAYKMLVNGKEFVSAGKVGTSKESMLPSYFPLVKEIPEKLEKIDLIIYISNYYHKDGGQWKVIKLGNIDDLRELREKIVVMDVLFTGGLLIMGIYHLVLYALRRKNKSPLYFSIVCLSIAFRTLATGERYIYDLFPFLNWHLIYRLEYFSTYISGVSFFILFVQSLFPEEFKEKVAKALAWLCISYTITMVDVSFFTSFRSVFEITVILISLYCVYILILAIRNKRIGAKTFLIGFLVFFASIINDMLYNMSIIKTGYVASLGLCICIFSQSYILSVLFSKAFYNAEKLSENLNLSNKELEETNIAYSKFVPREFLTFLNVDSITKIKLGDQVQQEMAILFSDIRSFTELSELMTPKENFEFINSYLKRMDPVIRTNHGVIDKYIGDAIMALFSRSVDDAINAAIEMQDAIKLYNFHRGRSAYKPIRVGIGIHVGTLMLGTIGANERMDVTVISDAVNLSSRLEGLTKVFGADILITLSSFDKVSKKDRYKYRYIGKIKVKGKKNHPEVIEIINSRAESEIKLIQMAEPYFSKGLEYYLKKDFKNAFFNFQEAIKIFPEDKAAKLYLDKTNMYLKYDIKDTLDDAEILTFNEG